MQIYFFATYRKLFIIFLFADPVKMKIYSVIVEIRDKSSYLYTEQTYGSFAALINN